jgi:hypothetical protein
MTILSNIMDFNQMKLNTRFCTDLIGNEQNKKFFDPSFLINMGVFGICCHGEGINHK